MGDPFDVKWIHGSADCAANAAAAPDGAIHHGVGPTVVSPAAISQLQALFLVPVLEFSPFCS
jgi:hypothetical protein